MIALIEQHREAIEALCCEYGVLRQEVFGEAATGGFDPDRSEVDFLVTYPEDYDYGPWISRYTELHAKLETLLGYPVRLVMSGAPYTTNRYSSEYLNETRQELYPLRSGDDI